MTPIRLVLADDHELVRDGIKSLLESESDFEVIDEASDGEEAIEVTSKTQPDLIIVDIRMPKKNGIEVVRNLSSKYPNIKKLVLSMHDSEEYVLDSIEAGADGYLLKGSSKTEFLKALRTISEGGKYFAGDVSAYLLKSLTGGHSKTPKSTPVETPVELEVLTNREKQILDLILQGKGNQDIAEELDISKRTAEVHRFNLMKKLNVKNLAELTHKAKELSLI